MAGSSGASPDAPDGANLIVDHPGAADQGSCACRACALGPRRSIQLAVWVYAAGDLTPGMQLLAVAAAEGTIAGVSCATSLHGHRTDSDAPTPAPDPRPLAPEHVPDA
jgi:hypothetical protein